MEKTGNEVTATPSQARVIEVVQRALERGCLAHVWGGSGRGKTTVLEIMHKKLGGGFLRISDFVDLLSESHPTSIEESLYQVLLDALRKNNLVVVDDLDLVTSVVCCNYNYPRKDLIDAPLTAIASIVVEKGARLLFSHAGTAPKPLRVRSYSFGIDKFQPDDYRFICSSYLSEKQVARIDFERVHRFAPKLNGHQLRASCNWLSNESKLDTDRFIEYIRSQRMATNVDLSEVEAVDLTALKGVDDVIKSLIANVVVPLEHDGLSEELELRPTRGVLLAGPPGTGKTTIGKALAHRLKGKFFLIDGTYITGTHDFYQRVQSVFAAAKESAPAVIFIDDSDVIFEDNEESGLYRFLLTQLDGLEGKAQGNVCVVMTAMDVGALPPALIRSGRIELWLETRIPDESARKEVLRSHLAGLPEPLVSADLDELLTVTDGFTGADLKGLMERGKTLFAYDRSQGMKVLHPPTKYFVSAANTIRQNQTHYREAEARARNRAKSRPPWFASFSTPLDDSSE